MMEKCFDEGTIQAFLDGELSLDLVDKVSHHVALCDSCAFAITEAEGEMEFAFSALDNEFNTLVPTERLWTKINNSIESEAKNRSIWQSIFAFLTTPSSLAFASLVIVFGLFAGLYGLKSSSDNEMTAKTSNIPETKMNKVDSSIVPVNIPSSFPQDANKSERSVSVNNKPENNADFRVRNADFRPEKVIRRIPREITKTNPPDVMYVSNNLAAEESYVKTISTLEKTVNSRKDEVFKPSARFAFEKDLAVADDTIKKLKDEVRNNPKNEAARVLLRNSYQNKINLLNSVAEKTELMASLN